MQQTDDGEVAEELWQLCWQREVAGRNRDNCRDVVGRKQLLWLGAPGLMSWRLGMLADGMSEDGAGWRMHLGWSTALVVKV